MPSHAAASAVAARARSRCAPSYPTSMRGRYTSRSSGGSPASARAVSAEYQESTPRVKKHAVASAGGAGGGVAAAACTSTGRSRPGTSDA
jgi:hypothetical protein